MTRYTLDVGSAAMVHESPVNGSVIDVAVSLNREPPFANKIRFLPLVALWNDVIAPAVAVVAAGSVSVLSVIMGQSNY